MSPSLPDWQLPPGTNRGLWDSFGDRDAARHYDAGLADSTLVSFDVNFARRHFPQPGRLLDLGCGTGRLLLAFAQIGYPVFGVDLSEEMLRIVGEKADEKRLPVHRLRANLVQLDCLADGSFDYAACMFNTLGIVAGAANRRRVIGHVYRLLRPGGTFVLHGHNCWFNVWNPAGRRWLLRQIFRPGLDRDWSMPAHEQATGWPMHLFTRRELCRLLTDVEFQLLDVRPIGLHGELSWPSWFGGLRAYGYLLAARKPFQAIRTVSPKVTPLGL